MDNDSADYVEKHVVYHYESADGYSEAFCEDHRHDFDTVHCAAEAYGDTAAYAGDNSTEEGAEKQVGACKGGDDAYVYREDVGYEPCGEGVYDYRIYCAGGELDALLFCSVKKEGNVEHKQENGQGEPFGGDLGEQNGSS